MKTIKNEIRPIGFVTLELNENEITTIIGALEELCFITRRPLEEMMGTRQDIYDTLKELVSLKK